MPDVPDYNEVFSRPPAHSYTTAESIRTQLAPPTGAVEIPAEELKLLFDRVAWRTPPPFYTPGRSAYAQRREPLLSGEDRVGGYKLKGVGNFDQETNTVNPPSTVPFFRRVPKEITRHEEGEMRQKLATLLPECILIHTGVREDGGFYPVLDSQKPLGGLPHGRGQREFENAVKLREGNVAACGPVRWGRYPDLEWEGKPMQWVILSTPDSNPQRMGAYFEPTFSHRGTELNPSFKALIEKRFDVFDPRKEPALALRLSAEMARGMGTNLRAAHEARVGRFASHTGNFSYLPEKRSTYMHDFDSSIDMDRDIGEKARSITMIRDLDSALIGMHHSICPSNLYYLTKDEETFKKTNPVGQLLIAYFDGDTNEAEAKAAAERISALTLQSLKSRGEYPNLDHQRVWISEMHMTLTIEFLKLCHSVYKKSRLAQRDPLPYNEQQLTYNLMAHSEASHQVYNQEWTRLTSQLPAWAKMMLGT